MHDPRLSILAWALVAGGACGAEGAAAELAAAASASAQGTDGSVTGRPQRSLPTRDPSRAPERVPDAVAAPAIDRKPLDASKLPPELRSAAESCVADLRGPPVEAKGPVDVIEARRVTWPDGSLGCAQPGVRYRMAPVEGVFVLLRHGNKLHRYHGSLRGKPQRCEGVSAPTPAPGHPAL